MHSGIDIPKDMIDTEKSPNMFCMESYITCKSSHYLFQKLKIKKLIRKMHPMGMKRGMKSHTDICCY